MRSWAARARISVEEEGEQPKGISRRATTEVHVERAGKVCAFDARPERSQCY